MMKKITLMLSCMMLMLIFAEQSRAANVVEYICLSKSSGAEIFSGSAPSDAVPRLVAVCSAAGGRLLAGFPL